MVLGVALKKLPNVKKTVVLSGGARFDKLDSRFMEKIHKNKIDKVYLLRCMGNYFNPLTYKYLKKLERNSKVIINDLIACEKFDIASQIKNIDIPVKIIVAEDEILTPVEYSKLIQREVKNSTLKILKNGRHFLMIVQAEKVAEEIKKFI